MREFLMALVVAVLGIVTGLQSCMLREANDDLSNCMEILTVEGEKDVT